MLQNILYQVNLFGDFIDVEAEPENIIKLMPLLQKYSLMPNTMQELNPNFGLSPLSRLSLISEKDDFRIEIFTDKISISKNTKRLDGIETQLPHFVLDSTYIIDQILNQFNRLGTRVSLITDGLFPETSKELLDNSYSKFVIPTEYFNENTPFEWNVRSVSNQKYIVSDEEELINIITDVGRVQGRFNNQQIEFDRINLKIDINTVAQNTKQRLDTASVESFLKSALRSRDELLMQVESVIDE